MSRNDGKIIDCNVKNQHKPFQIWHVRRCNIVCGNIGEFNNASARRALVDWYLSLFIMCKAGHQYNERPRALALLNLPPMCCVSKYVWTKNIFMD